MNESCLQPKPFSTYAHLCYFIKELEFIHSRADLVNILANKRNLLTNSMLWIFVDKKSSNLAFKININVPHCIEYELQSMSIGVCKRYCDRDNYFENHYSLLEWHPISFGLSLFYERYACFLFTKINGPTSSPKEFNIRAVVPYVLASFNNVAHYEEVEQLETTKIRLSKRQLQIVKWIAQGKTNKEIASELSVSQFTIKNHISAIYKKLNVLNRAHAIETLMRTDCLN